ncbi:MAG: RsmB/NOP family class I SAM-dependent RNA methyltransferase, partial [archaeon]
EKVGWKLKQVPFYKDGFVVNSNVRPALTVEHFMGYFYLQEVASMIPPLVLNPQSGDEVLDMCAAPGSKTTQLSELMHNKGLIVANDNDIIRLKLLNYAIEKCGCLNIAQTMMDGRVIAKVHEYDKILLDAPCSSEGQIRKEPEVLEKWNEAYVKQFSDIQKQLINSAFLLLKQPGVLVYSTCTFSPEENEEVVDSLLKKFKNAHIEKISLKGFKISDGFVIYKGMKFDPQVKNCARIWPHHNNTGGFFIAKIVKK